MKRVDLQNVKVLTGKNLEAAVAGGATEIVLAEGVVMTPTARDIIRRANLTIVGSHADSSASQPVRDNPAPRPAAPAAPTRFARADEALLNSPEATVIKQEMIRMGRKLWDRQYVDGNGGNITYRIAPERVICTPTLLSKGDLTLDDFCLVDLDGNQMAGKAKRTSEIYLHLQIYKTVPEAQSSRACPSASCHGLRHLGPRATQLRHSRAGCFCRHRRHLAL